jgi:hypothetical protein
MLSGYASQHGLNPSRFTRDSLAVAYHESGGYDAGAQNAIDPGSYGSLGIWQFNTSAHGYDPAFCDPVGSTAIWLQKMNPAGAYNACAGSSGDILSFMQCYAPKVQVSVPWDTGMAQRAINGANATIGQLGNVAPQQDNSGVLGHLGLPGPSDVGSALGGVGSAIGGAASGVAGGVAGGIRDVAGNAADSVAHGIFGDLFSGDTFERIGIFFIGLIAITAGIFAIVNATSSGGGSEAIIATIAREMG